MESGYLPDLAETTETGWQVLTVEEMGVEEVGNKLSRREKRSRHRHREMYHHHQHHRHGLHRRHRQTAQAPCSGIRATKPTDQTGTAARSAHFASGKCQTGTMDFHTRRMASAYHCNLRHGIEVGHSRALLAGEH